jgi:hypothetical protein
MTKYRASLLVGFLVTLGAGCEKTPAPPPEVATSPAGTAAPPAAATPVATPEPSAAPPPEPVATPEPPAPSAASAAPSPSAAPPKETGHKAAVVTPKPVPAPAESAPPPPGGATPDDACQTKNFHYSQVASACKSGGRKSAKVVMKGAVTKAKAAGTDLKCSSCHEDMKSFHLKSNAVDDLKKWL